MGSVHSNNSEEEDGSSQIKEQITPTPGATPGAPAEIFKKSITVNKNLNLEKEQEPMPKFLWCAKVARFIAYCIDGGLLCSQFTISLMIKMLQNVEDQEEILVNKELSYLLHIRKKGKEYERENKNLTKEFKELMNGYS